MPDVQQHLALILEHVGDGLTVQEAGGRLIYANESAARAMGFATVDDLLAAPVGAAAAQFAIFDEDGQPFPAARLPGRRVLAGEAESVVTARFRHLATGEDRWATIRASPVVDETGSLLFAVNVWQDVTRQKRDEAAQRFLAEAGEVLSGSLDLDATMANIANLAVPRLGDWCAVHLVHADLTIAHVTVAHVDPERAAWALQLQERYPWNRDARHGIAMVMRTGQPELIADITDDLLVAGARDEEQLDLLRRLDLSSTLIVPMMSRGRAIGAITLVSAESGRRYDERDLTLAIDIARHAALAVDNARLYDAERAARTTAEAAQGRFRALFEGVPDAILVVDDHGHGLDANSAASDLFGYPERDLLAAEVATLLPGINPRRDLLAIDQDVGEWRGESLARRSDGALVPVEIWSRRLDLPAGPIAIVVLRDVSERQAADRVREEVLAAISHDLRSPLSAIKLQAQSLLRLTRRGELPDRSRLEASLSAIDTMANRVSYLLGDIVDVARMSGGESPRLSPEPTDLLVLARRCAVEAEANAGREVLVVSECSSLVGIWDPHAIERVILNLLNNALKYSQSDREVRLDLAGDERWATLAVTDRGIGIPRADLPRVFERYRRGRNVGAISGTGLGLTGARQIVEGHGGSIAIESEEGQGTTVTVRLPLGDWLWGVRENDGVQGR